MTTFISKPKRLLVTTLFAAGLLFSAFASKAQTTGHDSQNSWHLGIGIEPGTVLGNRNDRYPFVLGGSLRLQYDLKSRTSLMLTTGYTNFFGSDYTLNPSTYYVNGNNISGTIHVADAHVIPVKAGVKVFVVSHLYLSGEAGAAFGTESIHDVSLVLSPGIGYAFSDSGFDLGVRYDNYSESGDSFGMISARIAYGFKL